MTEPTLQRSDRIKQVAERQVGNAAAFRPSPGTERRAVTSVHSRALHDLQLKATVEGHSFLADEAEAKAGHDAGPAPMRYFLAGLMMCHQVWCIKGSALRGIDLASLEGDISCYVGASGDDEPVGHGRVLDLIRYRLEITSESSSSDLVEVVEDALRRCPAVGTVVRGARLELVFVHNGETVLDDSYGPAFGQADSEAR